MVSPSSPWSWLLIPTNSLGTKPRSRPGGPPARAGISLSGSQTGGHPVWMMGPRPPGLAVWCCWKCHRKELSEGRGPRGQGSPIPTTDVRDSLGSARPVPELRATGAGGTLPQAVANLGLSGLSLETTREHLETAEMRQKCHREAIHVEAGSHKCPGTVGRARAVRPKRPLQRGCWGMPLHEMGMDMDGDRHGCE